MKFSELIDGLVSGKRYQLPEWKEEDLFLCMEEVEDRDGGFSFLELSLCDEDGAASYSPTEEDFTRNDWYEI